jgi:hypothetical protein
VWLGVDLPLSLRHLAGENARGERERGVEGGWKTKESRGGEKDGNKMRAGEERRGEEESGGEGEDEMCNMLNVDNRNGRREGDDLRRRCCFEGRLPSMSIATCLEIVAKSCTVAPLQSTPSHPISHYISAPHSSSLHPPLRALSH